MTSRWLSGSWCLVAALGGSACLSSETVLCLDGRRCPPGTVCAATSLEGPLCVGAAQLAQCEGQPDGTSCGDGTARCYEQVCLPGGCGNRRVDVAEGEICDDGNNVAGDGCAADCLSAEVCGNATLDAILGEDCDDGDVYSGDGCSSVCERERMRVFSSTMDSATTAGLLTGAYDLARDRYVTMGTEWDGHGWILHGAEPAPPVRVRSAAAYDPRRKRVIVFGGMAGGVSGETTLFSDTWAWNGAEWRDLDTEHAPPPRRDHVLAYDSARDLVVLFGGNSSGDEDNYLALGDTWVFDGADWQQVLGDGPPPQGHPRARASPAGAARVATPGLVARRADRPPRAPPGRAEDLSERGHGGGAAAAGPAAARRARLPAALPPPRRLGRRRSRRPRRRPPVPPTAPPGSSAACPGTRPR